MTSTAAANPLVEFTQDIEPRPIPEALLAARRDVMAAVRELATLKAEVDRYTKRRDSVVAQLGSLRDVIAGFGDDSGSKAGPADR